MPTVRFTVLDSWRGICALWVAVFHFRVISHFGDAELFRHGHLAVEFFFVLSGFVITCAYGDRLKSTSDRVSFMIRRFGRLYPLHLATLLVVIAMETARWAISMKLGREVGGPLFAGATDPAALLPNFLLMHGWGLLPEFTWNVPSWSISVEFMLCIFFVLAFMLPHRKLSLVLMTLLGAAAVLGRVVDLGAPWIDASNRFLGDGLTLVYLAILIAVSMVTYRLIETPGRDWFNAISHKVRKPAPAASRS